jgi:hypothetical protein
VERARAHFGGELAGRRALLAGVTYLPGVADTRSSPAAAVARALLAEGAEVRAVDATVRSWPELPGVPLGPPPGERDPAAAPAAPRASRPPAAEAARAPGAAVASDASMAAGAARVPQAPSASGASGAPRTAAPLGASEASRTPAAAAGPAPDLVVLCLPDPRNRAVVAALALAPGALVIDPWNTLGDGAIAALAAAGVAVAVYGRGDLPAPSCVPSDART